MARIPRTATKKKVKKRKNKVSTVAASNDVTMGEGSKKASKGSSSTKRPSVWRPGIDELEDGEELQCDPTAYHCLHWFELEWPSLSFDILRDDLGAQRTEFPHTLYFVAGTQANDAVSNALVILKASNLTQMKQPKQEGEEESDEDDESSSDEEDEDEDEAMAGTKDGTTKKNANPLDKKRPRLQQCKVVHHGGVNRVRAMMQQPAVVASWSESGHVQVWDMSAHLKALEQGQDESQSGARKDGPIRQSPLQIFSGHADEGFALDWSPVTPGRLVSGDCKSGIHVWQPSEAGKWVVEKSPYKGHTASVEDLQWSPTEAEVFASCSVDQTIRIWDARCRDASALTVKAHDADINVLSWNRLASCMLASGCDDGSFRIWDLRNFKADSFVAHFSYHRQPISSIEWSPDDSSMIACTSGDNLLTIWDLSLERDPEEEEEFTQGDKTLAVAPDDLPSQLLFVHQGQTDLKELHWHPQIPGMLISTASDGLNVFKPSNLANLTEG